MTDVCPHIVIRHEPPEPLNRFEKFSDDFVSDFHKAKSQDDAVNLAQRFLSEVQQWTPLQQQIMLERAQQSDAATGCGLDIPRLDITFADDGHGNQTLDHLGVTTIDDSQTWHFGVAEATWPHTKDLYERMK